MNLKVIWCAALGVLIAAAAFSYQISASRLEARLLGIGNDRGKAKWQIRNANQAELEVEGENLVPNETYFIQIGKNTPWSVETNALGAFEMEQRYLGTARPSIPAGSEVVVVDEFGNTILYGTLAPR